MAGKWRKKKVKSLTEAGIDPMKLVPTEADETESGRDSKGLIQVRRRFEPAGRIHRWIARKLKYKHETHLKLDQAGSAFWEQMDGRRDLGRIAEAMARKFEADPAESRRAAVEFARALTKKRLIHLILPAEAQLADRQGDRQEQED
jgi:hypothetical protein